MGSILRRLWVAALGMASMASGQMLTNPMQDYINKTTLLNDILGNTRAIEINQQAQKAGAAPNGSSVQTAPAREATKFEHKGAVLLPKQLAAGGGPDAERHLASLISLYEQTARNDGMPANDLAYALEYFLVNTFMTYHDLHDVEYSKGPRAKRGKDGFERIALMGEKKSLQVTLYQERAVYAQFKSLLSANALPRRGS